tara:strand:- start:123543 stop:124277 length:735 start_codon:yes stop_codon:yes gene_type:complete
MSSRSNIKLMRLEQARTGMRKIQSDAKELLDGLEPFKDYYEFFDYWQSVLPTVRTLALRHAAYYLYTIGRPHCALNCVDDMISDHYRVKISTLNRVSSNTIAITTSSTLTEISLKVKISDKHDNSDLFNVLGMRGYVPVLEAMFSGLGSIARYGHNGVVVVLNINKDNPITSHVVAMSDDFFANNLLHVAMEKLQGVSDTRQLRERIGIPASTSRRLYPWGEEFSSSITRTDEYVEETPTYKLV